MIPVTDSELLVIDINNEPNVNYKNLLMNQFRELVTLKSVIYNKAQNLYSLFKRTDGLSSNDIKVKDRCCDFLLLEQKMSDYILQKQANNTNL